MIGNDVVDLGDPETRPGATHPRFDDRVFAAAEREALEASGAPNRLRWIFWAAKEAAFKVARKLDPGAVFSPSSFAVELTSDLRGSVEHGEQRFCVQVDESPHCVHAIVSDADPKERRIHAEVAAMAARVDIPEEWPPATVGPASVRALARYSVAELLGANPADVSIARENRIPRLLLKGEPAGVDLSLSHHGRFVAFACDLGEERPSAP